MPYSWKGVYGAGEEPQKGDIVRCRVNCYCGVHQGDVRIVLEVEDGAIWLKNNRSPYKGQSRYRASSFELINRAASYQQLAAQGQPQETKYMHIAIRQHDGFSYDELVKQINTNPLSLDFIADTNGAALKQRVQARIEANPDEVWLILGGHTVASGKRRPAVDVSFRSL